MKIYFTTIPGFESAIWEYDELSNRATYSPPVQSPKKGDMSVFEMPQGMVMNEHQFVINDVKTFTKSYPHTSTLLESPLQKSRHSRLSKIPEEKAVDKSNEKTPGISIISPTTSESSFFGKSKRSPSSSRSPDKSPQSSPEPLLRRSTKKRESPSPIRSNVQPLLTEEDYPSSLCLHDLINNEFNQSSCGETITYRKLYKKKKKEKKNDINKPPHQAAFLRDNRYFHELIEMPLQHYRLKKQLLDTIEKLLGLFNNSYEQFCAQNKLTHATRKEITDYFCQAVIQTMANGDLKKAPTEFQAEINKGMETLFRGGKQACDRFNSRGLELRIEALQLNWLALIETDLEINQSTACTLHKNTQVALNDFKSFLSANSQTETKKVIQATLEIVKSKLFELVVFEQKEAADLQIYHSAIEKKEEPFEDYLTLSTLISKSFALSIKKMPFDMHLMIQKDLVTNILRGVICKLALLKQEIYNPFMAKITTYSSTELYIKTEWVEKIQNSIELLFSDKKIKKYLPKLHSDSLSEINTAIDELATRFSQTIYDNLFSLLEECIYSSRIHLGVVLSMS